MSGINPGATEICDDLDNNCDGEVDEDSATDAIDWYPDVDGDGYGDALASVDSTSCNGGSGLVTDNTDCDDSDSAAWPGAPCFHRKIRVLEVFGSVGFSFAVGMYRPPATRSSGNRKEGFDNLTSRG